MKFLTKDKLVIVPDWEANTIYKINNVVLYNSILYRCGTPHKSNNTFDTAYWEPISSSGGGGGGTSNYSQITKLNVTAPKTELIPIEITNTFAKAPVEILKFTTGENDVLVTVCDFDNSDASDFKNNEFLTFNGNMSLKVMYDITMKGPASLGSTYVSESEEIDTSNFKKIANMEVI